MNNYVSSLIRTWVPTAVGAVVTYLAAKGVILGKDAADGAVTALTAVIIGIYYAAARYVETKKPNLGWLLGLAKAPGYAAADPPPAQPPPGGND